jgi:hypothetical protein
LHAATVAVTVPLTGQVAADALPAPPNMVISIAAVTAAAAPPTRARRRPRRSTVVLVDVAITDLLVPAVTVPAEACMQ